MVIKGTASRKMVHLFYADLHLLGLLDIPSIFEK